MDSDNNFIMHAHAHDASVHHGKVNQLRSLGQFVRCREGSALIIFVFVKALEFNWLVELLEMDRIHNYCSK